MPGSPERKDATEVMKYMEQMGKDISDNARQVMAMIEFAKENNITIDLSTNEKIEKFAPLGEYEVALIKLRAELGSLKTDLLNQGVKVTYEELNQQHVPMENTNLNEKEIKN